MSDKIEEQVNQICERARHEILAAVLALQSVGESMSAPASTQEWMTAKQLAQYWQLYSDGEPATSGIMKWTRRSADQFPLPHARMGDMTRFKREDADRWASEEASRKRVEKNRKRLRQGNGATRLGLA